MGGLVAEDATKDVHEDVQKHAKSVSRPHKTRSKARAAPVDHPESIAASPGAGHFVVVGELTTCQDAHLTGKPRAGQGSLLRVAQGVP